MPISTEQYKTKDLAEASLLLIKGVKLCTMEKQGGICWFVFNKDVNQQELTQNFWFGECLVNARDYHQTMSSLKNRIYSFNQ